MWHEHLESRKLSLQSNGAPNSIRLRHDPFVRHQRAPLDYVIPTTSSVPSWVGTRNRAFRSNKETEDENKGHSAETPLTTKAPYKVKCGAWGAANKHRGDIFNQRACSEKLHADH